MEVGIGKAVVTVLLLTLALTSGGQAADEQLANDEPVLLSMTWTAEDGYKLQEGQLAASAFHAKGGDNLAVANFTNKINQTGWSYLEVKTSGKYQDNLQAYAGGYLEGFATAEVLYMYWVNTVQGYCDGDMADVCDQLQGYLAENKQWVRSQIAHHCYSKPKCDPYWHQVDLFYQQIEGLAAGYQEQVKRGKVPGSVSASDIFFMNIFGDMEDLSQSLVHNHKLNVSLNHVLGDGHCSALIKLLPGNADLYASHVTWNSYQSMLRTLKKYTFEFREGRGSQRTVPGRSMAFSGYPGIIYSGDDFTVISPSGLAAIETTIGNSNASLWKFVQPAGSVLEGIRSTVANRLAHNGKQWMHIFARHNSGTYNNQWMVIDYKRFRPGKPMSKGLLWILEQLPGHVHTEDMTGFLLEHGYWPSYNTPYFKEIYNISGSPELAEKYGDWFTYDKTPRALIFKRDQGKVTDLQSMERLMRYNNFKEDPLSACECSPPYSAENAISARNDLNPRNGTYPFGALGHRSHGGTDMKVTSYDLFKRMQFVAVSSPAYDDLPPFQWSKTDFASDTPHMGMPDLWDFKPVTHQWQLP